MSEFSFATPRNFLGLPPEHSDFERSKALILPVPYEMTTSYRGGTKEGPYAILDASTQVELYDADLDDEPALRWGIHTLPALAPDLSSPEAAVESIAAAVAHFAGKGKLLGVLGGEHTVSVGVARGLRRVFGEFVTVQLDAHADLRESYEGTPYSHACAARRISEISRVVQLGIRSLDSSEARFLREHPDRVTTIFAADMQRNEDYLASLAEIVRGRQVFLTLDIDALDPSIMPSTGTPEPGGLLWYETLALLRFLTQQAEIIGFDVVELAPLPGLHAPDFLVAKLIYKLLTLILDKDATNLIHPI